MSKNCSPQKHIIAGEDNDGRPEDCTCWDADLKLPCWPCFRAGFDHQNPAESGTDESNQRVRRGVLR